MANTATPPSTEQPRLLGSGPRRWRWLSLGLTLMIAGGLGAYAALSQTDDRVGVLVADTDIPAGHSLQAEDLTVAEIAGEDAVSTISGADLDYVLGQTVNVPVSEGAVLFEEAVGSPGDYPDAGQAVVGADLQPSQYPASLEPGTHVSVVAASPPQQEDAADEDAALDNAVSAQVQSITQADDGTTLVELLVDATDATAVAQAATAGELALVRTPHGGM